MKGQNVRNTKVLTSSFALVKTPHMGCFTTSYAVVIKGGEKGQKAPFNRV